jgi:antitoxin VapB
MHIDQTQPTSRGADMALQITDPVIIRKIEALARETGLSKATAVEKAVDRLLAEQNSGERPGIWEEFDAILAQIDRIPDLPNAFDPLEWDEQGLPR